MNTYPNSMVSTNSEHFPTNDKTLYSNPQSIQRSLKTLQQLDLMDAFLFEAATEQDESAKTIAKTIIERAIGIKVEHIEIEREKPLKGVSLYNRGIRMDIYVKEQQLTADGLKTLRVFDIEPNKYREPNLPHRNRYCQAMIDSKLLPVSSDFLMPALISIWILPYDPFGDDRMLYTVKNVVVENTKLDYNDGVLKLFLYTKGTKGGSKELKALLKYLENTTETNAVDDALSDIQKIVTDVKSMEELGEHYMTLQDYLNYEIRDGISEGLKEAMNALRADITIEVRNEVKDEIRNEVKDEVRNEVKDEVRNEVKNELRNESLAVFKFIKNSLTQNMDKTDIKAALLKNFNISETDADEYLELY